MKIIDRIELFVNMFEELKDFDKDNIKDYLSLKRYKNNETKLILEEYLTLIILYRFSGYKNLKRFWYNEKYFSNNCWPNMPSYNRFIVWINRLEKLLKNILDKYLKNLHQELGMVDSTKIETTTTHWRGKIHKDSRTGDSSTGEFKGFKLHALINDKNQLCSYSITPGNIHDLTAVKEEFFFKGHTGKVLADSGYIGKDFYYKLMEQNLTLIAKPNVKMMENNFFGFGYLPAWEINFKKLYKKRTKIERFFSYLKENLNLKINKLHSSKALYTHVYSSLLAIQWLNLGIIKHFIVN